MSPSVVALEAVKPTVKEGKRDPWTTPAPASWCGSPGQKGLFVLTNNHVIGKAPANQITINISDSRILKPTRVWTDPESDIALLARPRGRRPDRRHARRQRQDARRAVGAGVRLAIRPQPDRDARHHQRQRARPGQPRLDHPHQGLLADRRRDQPRLERRAARQPRRRGDRHQYRHRLPVGEQLRHRLQHPDQHDQEGRGPAPRQGPGDARLPRRAIVARLRVGGGDEARASAGRRARWSIRSTRRRPPPTPGCVVRT